MVSVVIPMYNEESGIGQVVEEVAAVLGQYGIEGEIITVDDGSTDGSRAAANAHEGVAVLSHRSNRGYGAALKTGIRSARYDYVFITDADGTYPSSELPHFLRRAIDHRADMIVGARTDGTAIPVARRPAKWLLGKLANYVSGQRIPDINSGLRLFRRDLALQVFDLLPDGFSFTTTLTLAMFANGYVVEYVPIEYRVRTGRSKIRPIHDTLAFLQLVLRMGLYFAPLRIFLPLSVALLVLAIGWGLSSRLIMGQVADVSSLVIAMTAIQIGAIGLVAELINHRVSKSGRGSDR